MRRTLTAALAALSLLAWALPALAVPSTMPVQGVVRDNAGTPVDGAFSMTFALYGATDAVDALWSESWPPDQADCSFEPTPAGCVQISNGVFSARLGAHDALDVATLSAATQLWLGVAVEGEPELERQALGSVGYALSSARAAVAEAIDCTGCIPQSALGFEVSTTVNPDDLDEVSNGLLTNQFDESFSSAAAVTIPDYFPPGVADILLVPEIGATVQSLTVSVSLTNSEVADLTIKVHDPNGQTHDVYSGSESGTSLDISWTEPFDTWIGQNPGGAWTLEVIDAGFHGGETDGEVVVWSVSAATLSSTQVAVQGDLIVNGSISGPGGLKVGTEPTPCDAAHAGSIYFDADAKRLVLCDGTELLQLRACSPDCPDAGGVSCGEPVESECGDDCGATGAGLSVVQCLTSRPLTPCNTAVTDGCGNDCAMTGTGFDAPSCPAAADTPCGTTILDPCGNVCGGLGESCGLGDTCLAGGCVAYGSTPDTAGASCKDINDQEGTAASGEYYIDPDGDGGSSPVLVYCDMDHAGGGWTLVLHTWKAPSFPAVPQQTQSFAEYESIGVGTASGYVGISTQSIYFMPLSVFSDLSEGAASLRFANELNPAVSTLTGFSMASDYDLEGSNQETVRNEMCGGQASCFIDAGFSTYDQDNASAGSCHTSYNNVGWWYDDCFTYNATYTQDANHFCGYAANPGCTYWSWWVR